MRLQHTSERHIPVAVVGAGPVGLTAAIDLHIQGIAALVFDQGIGACDGSRAIAWAKRTLEVYDRLGLGQRLREEGVVWQIGKVFWDTKLIYEFDLLPDTENSNPAFVNMQQYRVEEILLEKLNELGAAPVYWQYRLVELTEEADCVRLVFETPSGKEVWTCDHLLACDGARSTIRRQLGLTFEGQVFKDQFLISDVRMKADFPTERWFWFDPPFNRGKSALLHKQPDNVWRIDQQIGAEADAEEESKPENVTKRLRAMLGPAVDFEIVWISVYTFQCRRLNKFRHGRISFVGDSAHQVSPFGGRGGNCGIQDADNIVWKLAMTLRGDAPSSLLDTYDDERLVAADDNIAHSTRATDFISPKSPIAETFRDAVLTLSESHKFARAFVNSGRLSQPTPAPKSPLNTKDRDAFSGGIPPGAPCADAPIITDDGRKEWLLRQLGGRFTAIIFVGIDDSAEEMTAQEDCLNAMTPPVNCVFIDEVASEGSIFGDPAGLAAYRYDARHGTVYLVRPDQYVAARFRRFDKDAIEAALHRAVAGH